MYHAQGNALVTAFPFFPPPPFPENTYENYFFFQGRLNNGSVVKGIRSGSIFVLKQRVSALIVIVNLVKVIFFVYIYQILACSIAMQPLST